MPRRKKEQRITDPSTHPKRTVCLRVAAEYLEIDERTLRLFVESGDLPAFRPGRIYRIAVTDLMAFERRGRGPDPIARETFHAERQKQQ